MANKSEKECLSMVEVCKIIATCQKYGVAKLKFGALDLEFSPSMGNAAPQQLMVGGNKKKIEIEQDKVIKDEILKQEIAAREDQIAELWLTDPLLAEQMLENGELRPSDGVDDGREE